MNLVTAFLLVAGFSVANAAGARLRGRRTILAGTILAERKLTPKSSSSSSSGTGNSNSGSKSSSSSSSSSSSKSSGSADSRVCFIVVEDIRRCVELQAYGGVDCGDDLDSLVDFIDRDYYNWDPTWNNLDSDDLRDTVSEICRVVGSSYSSSSSSSSSSSHSHSSTGSSGSSKSSSSSKNSRKGSGRQ